MAKLKILQFTTFLLILFNFVQSEEQMNSRKLDEITPPDLGNKCGGCPCNNPCLPPPSLPPPSPPPPSPPPPPPPKSNPPPSNYCPPPPSGGGGGGGGGGSGGGGGGGGGGSGSGGGEGGGQYPPNSPYIYINGPPGNLYPVDLSGSGRVFAMGQLPFLITITSVLGVLVI